MTEKLVSRHLIASCTAMVVLMAGCAAPPAAVPATSASATAPSTATTQQAPADGAAVTNTDAPTNTQGLPPLPQGGLPGVMPGGMTQVKATPAAKDVAYANQSATQTLDIYLPDGDGPFPLVINVHGGGFMMGDKSNPALTDQLLEAGYAVASLNYRLSGEAKAPAQIEDVKAAVRWLRANAAQYKLNSDKFAAFGQSAGGNLVSLLGTSCGVAELEGDALGNADQSSCVQAVVDWFGPTDFLQMDAQFAGTSCPANHNEANSPESQLVGAPIQTVPDKVKQVNPITYANAKAPPFLIQHGTADCNVPPQQGKLLADALVPLIGADKVTYTLLEGAGHGGSQFEADENVKVVIDFLNKHLK